MRYYSKSSVELMRGDPLRIGSEHIHCFDPCRENFVIPSDDSLNNIQEDGLFLKNSFMALEDMEENIQIVLKKLQNHKVVIA